MHNRCSSKTRFPCKKNNSDNPTFMHNFIYKCRHCMKEMRLRKPHENVKLLIWSGTLSNIISE